MSYQIPHYLAKGWVGYNEVFAWAESFEKSNLKEFIKGIVVWIWRLVDFGRIFLDIALLIVLVKKRNSLTKDKNLFGFLILLVIMTLGFSYSFLFFKGLRGHRYLLPMYFTISLIFVLLLEKINTVAKYVYWIVILGLLSGHLWIYPDKIAQGWDCSLAHLPYYDLREQLVDFINTKGYEKNNIGSYFPNFAEEKYLYLNNDTSKFKPAEPLKDKLLFYSNVYNVSDEEYDVIFSNYTPVKKFSRNGVYVVLLELPDKKH